MREERRGESEERKRGKWRAPQHLLSGVDVPSQGLELTHTHFPFRPPLRLSGRRSRTIRLSDWRGKSSLPWELALLLLLLATNLMGPVKLQSVVASDPLPHPILRYSLPALTEYSRLSPFLPSSLPPCLMSAAIDLHQDKMKHSAVHVQ